MSYSLPLIHYRQWPDLVILHVLNYLPLNDLICSIALINTTWRRLTLQFFAQRKTLRVLVGPLSLTNSMYAAECERKWSPLPSPQQTLNLATITEFSIVKLVGFFARVSHIELYLRMVNTEPKILILLSKILQTWDNNIIKVEITLRVLSQVNQYNSFENEFVSRQYHSAMTYLLTVLKQLSRLRQLSLNTEFKLYNLQNKNIAISFISADLIPFTWSWLDSCQLFTRDSEKNLLELLLQYGDKAPKRLSLHSEMFKADQLTKLPLTIVDRIEEVFINIFQFRHYNQLHELSRLSSLVKLKMNMDVAFLTSKSGLSKWLQLLPTLRTLNIVIDLTDYYYLPLSEEDKEQQVFNWMPTLPWIRELGLVIGYLGYSVKVNHAELESNAVNRVCRPLAVIFPNLSRCWLTVKNCGDCHRYGDNQELDIVKRKECDAALVRAFRPLLSTLKMLNHS